MLPADLKARILAAFVWSPNLRLVGLDERACRAALENARLALVQRNIRLALVTVPVIAMATAFLLAIWVEVSAALIWAGSYTAICMGAMLLAQRIESGATPEIAGRNLSRCGLLLAIATAPWGALPLFFWSTGGTEIHCVILLLGCGGIPWAMACSGPSVRVSSLQFVPLVAGLLLPPMLQAGPLYFYLSCLGVVYAIAMYGLALQINGLLTTMFRAQTEKVGLLGAVANAKAESDAARMKAERTSQAKSTFLANMSHELRTPLNAVLGFSEVIKNELLGPIGTQTYKEYAGDIYDSGRHLLGLINDILDLSRIEAGRLDLSLIELNVWEVVGDASRFVAQAAKQNGVTLKCRLPTDLPQIHADERSLRQILLNLLSNAVKFTSAGGSVTISASMGSSVFGPHGMTICVSDTGIGIEKDDISIVLEPFGQAHHEGGALISRREQGTGLGLPIVRALVEAHGGAFELKSEIGKGTTAIAHFPQTCVVERAPGEPFKSAV